jgi:threonine dehydratase
MVRLELDSIRRPRTSIDPVFLDTPQFECAPLGDVLGCSITLKVETLNPVRSFKGRGTETAVSRLVPLSGASTEDARLLARRIAADQGAHLIEDSLDPATCEGAGTVGLELLARGAPLDTVW